MNGLRKYSKINTKPTKLVLATLLCSVLLSGCSSDNIFSPIAKLFGGGQKASVHETIQAEKKSTNQIKVDISSARKEFNGVITHLL